MRIYKVPSEVLRAKTKKVTNFGKETQDLIDKMLATMRLAMGVGLAAPQVGESLKLFVAEHIDIEKEIADVYVVANPKIEWRSFDMKYDGEACLSVPRYQTYIERSTKVGISGLDRFGNKLEIEAEGYLARVFQHEIDHLNGVLIEDL